MNIGAIILTAGVREITGVEMINKEITTARNAGVSTIIVVTGYCGDDVRKAIVRRKVVQVENENYLDGQMLDSIKIGLELLEKSCQRFFIVPLDVCAFSADTLSRMIGTMGDVVIPTFKGRCGHPILIDTSVRNKILSYEGDGGLAAMMETDEIEVKHIEVDDSGILMEVTTQKEYEDALRHEREQRMGINFSPLVSISIYREGLFFSEPLADILKAIGEGDSINSAAAKRDMAYSRAWTMIKAAESQLGFSLLHRIIGGAGGGSSTLTEDGKKWLEIYNRLKKDTEAFVKERLEELLEN